MEETRTKGAECEAAPPDKCRAAPLCVRGSSYRLRRPIGIIGTRVLPMPIMPPFRGM